VKNEFLVVLKNRFKQTSLENKQNKFFIGASKSPEQKATL